MVAHRYRLPLALGAAALAAGGATLLLRPRTGVVAPTAASASDYFTSAQLQRARDWAAPQRLIGLGSLALEGAVLALIVWKQPPSLDRLGRRPVAGAATAGAALSAGFAVVALPLSMVRE